VGVALCLCVSSTAVQADPIVYSSRSSFEAVLAGKIVDDNSAPGYRMGDRNTAPEEDYLDVHSDAQMSSVVGETEYQTTGFTNLNVIFAQDSDPKYCAGCNGSFRLTFQDTSVGDESGVFGVGFQFFNTYASFQYGAFVTFGDGSTASYVLPLAEHWTQPQAPLPFFGITAPERIRSIHFGLAGGTRADTAGSFGIDDLTIGSEVPEPATLLLFGVGLAGVGARRMRRR
jgi:hypothetical protein